MAGKMDQRVQLTQEVLTAMRIIKMYTWELFFGQSIHKLRKKEISNLRTLFYIKALGLSIGQLSAKLSFYICVVMYIMLGYHITAEKAFVVTGGFEALRSVVMYFIPLGIIQFAELKASVQRIAKFLLLEEVPENYNAEYLQEIQPKVILKNVTIRSDKSENILEDVSLDIKPGLTTVTGSVGAGKSSLLKIILGDIRKSKGNLEVTGKISYASQEPWLFPGTVKQNIIFSEWFDPKRYEAVIRVCALKQDIEVFPDGDSTCVTDKGLNLSRGQKTRISLARAVYKIADVYLLDDCLSAVDTHVAKHIFLQCIKGFLKDTICILVTHQAQFLPEADNIVILNKGSVKFHGSYSALKETDQDTFKAVTHKDGDNVTHVNPSNALTKIDDFDDSAEEFSKLLTDVTAKNAVNVYGETKEEGSVKKEVYFTYFLSGGGYPMVLLVLFLAIVAQIAGTWSEYFVSSWVDLEQKLSSIRLNQTTNSTEYRELEEEHDSVVKQYSVVILVAVIFTIFKGFSFFIYCTKISTNIHNSMLNRILNTGMKFFDLNLSGNILNRFSRDLGLIDDIMPFAIFECSLAMFLLVSVLIIVTLMNPVFLIPSAIFAVILAFARRLYIPTGRSIRRLQGSTRSAVIGHLNASLEGLTTIRASQAQRILKREFDKHQDRYNSASYMYMSTTRAFGFHLDIIGTLYISMLLLITLFGKSNTLAGRVGLALTQSLGLTKVLQWGVRQWAELENQMTAVERALEYTKTDTEEKSGATPSNWPSNGKIVYKNVSLRYSSTAERVLKDVSFVIEPRQKIGIVGRTGAGKSSIISTLFRLYEFRGTITIDGMDINGVALEHLRSKISIIPQDPVLFSGTVRSNMDPNDEFSDKQLWDALDQVEMKQKVSSLDSIVSDGGSNFSIGQKQLISLARAILRHNVVLVLDEATANVDPETDALIQRTIRTKFYDCTVITIAHRLHTVMDCDRIIVMDSGVVVEFENPKVLVENKKGVFSGMIKEAGLV